MKQRPIRSILFFQQVMIILVSLLCLALFSGSLYIRNNAEKQATAMSQNMTVTQAAFRQLSMTVYDYAYFLSHNQEFVASYLQTLPVQPTANEALSFSHFQQNHPDLFQHIQTFDNLSGLYILEDNQPSIAITSGGQDFAIDFSEPLLVDQPSNLILHNANGDLFIYGASQISSAPNRTLVALLQIQPDLIERLAVQMGINIGFYKDDLLTLGPPTDQMTQGAMDDLYTLVNQSLPYPSTEESTHSKIGFFDVCLLPTSPGQGLIMITDYNDSNDFLLRSLSLLLAFFMSLLGLSIIATYFLGSYVTKPFIKLSESLHQITTTKNRVEVSADIPITEVEDTIIAVNDLLDTLDATESQKHMLVHETNRDGLTGLYNHRYFYQYLEELNQLYLTSSVAIVFIDLDHFKHLNDSLGHTRGDFVLQAIAQRLQAIDTYEASAFRYGGEEFVLILESLPIEEAPAFGDNLCKMIEEDLEIQDHVHPLQQTISVGIALYPDHSDHLNHLVKLADMAMYYSKNNGRNQSHVYNKTIEYIIEHQGTAMAQREVLLKSVYALVQAIEAKDKYTSNHSVEVAKFASLMGKAMEFDDTDINNLTISATIHDIGKIGIQDDILSKTGPLTDGEYRRIKEHPVLGVDIVNMLFEKGSEILSGIRHHHEWWDGSGYPDGLQGSEIPLFARIISIADAYHAMTSKRSYREAHPESFAVEELIDKAGKQFDPLLVELFIDLLKTNVRTRTLAQTSLIPQAQEVFEYLNDDQIPPQADESSPYIMVVDRSYNILFTNRSMKDRLGLDLDNAIGTKCFETLHGNSKPCDHCKLPRMFVEKRISHSTSTETLVNGLVQEIEQIWIPVMNQRGDIIYTVEIAYPMAQLGNDPKEAKQKRTLS